MAGNYPKIFFVFGALTFLVSCSSISRKQEKQFHTSLNAGNYKAAYEQILAGNYYPRQKSRLIRFLDLGALSHLQGNYYQSLKYMERAKEIADKLFTVSVKKKILTYAVSDNEDNYYGEIYERSYLRYYLALNHLLLSQQGYYEKHRTSFLEQAEKLSKYKKEDSEVHDYIAKRDLSPKERTFHLQAASAALTEWDSFLDREQKELQGEARYKSDLSQRAVAANTFESMGRVRNINKARSLYKSAKDILFKNFNIFSTYNLKNNLFKKDFEKLPGMKKKDIEKNYVLATNEANDFLSFVDENIKNLKRKDSASKVTFLISEGMIPGKKAHRVTFPIGFNTLTINTLSKSDFISYVRKVLAVTAGGIPSISFELPSMGLPRQSPRYFIKIMNKLGEVHFEKPLPIVSPLGHMAREALIRRSAGLKARVGTRLVAKHMSALVASYMSYRSMNHDGDNEGMALAVSSASYFLANKAIAASERADLRSWKSLPNNIRIQSFRLPAGEYTPIIFDKVTGVERTFTSFVVHEKSKNLIYVKRFL